jgi:dihydroneopterin aldolase
MKFLREQYNRLRIVDMEMICIVGILQEERSVPQRLFINAELDVDFEEAKSQGATMTSGVDYSQVAERIKETIELEEFFLLEDLLSGCCQACFGAFPALKGMMLRASKPDILPNCARVEAEISMLRPQV